MEENTVKDYFEVLRGMLENCDMETRTSVEKLFRQYVVYQQSSALQQVREMIGGLPYLSDYPYDKRTIELILEKLSKLEE